MNKNLEKLTDEFKKKVDETLGKKSKVSLEKCFEKYLNQTEEEKKEVPSDLDKQLLDYFLNKSDVDDEWI